jgi:hypothetical protein
MANFCYFVWKYIQLWQEKLKSSSWTMFITPWTHFQPRNHTPWMYVYKSIFNSKFLKYGMCKHGANLNFNVDNCITNTCLSLCTSSTTMCYNTKHLKYIEYSTPNLITPKTSNPVWKWNNIKMTLHFNKALSIPSMQKVKTLHKTDYPQLI